MWWKFKTPKVESFFGTPVFSARRDERYLRFVSLQGASRHAGIDVTYYFFRHGGFFATQGWTLGDFGFLKPEKQPERTDLRD